MSARRAELLERAYDHVLAHGLADMSLRPLATAVGSSPRVLLLLFGSKEGLVRALLDRARADELALLAAVRATGAPVAAEVWQWLAAPAHRPLLVLWAEAYVRSLVDPGGPWAGFARSTVEDWLAVLSPGEVRPTLTLAVLRGALLDLLATGDVERTTAAVTSYLGGAPG
ncbi:TetR family transcriptional regulator [Amorphoplanes nipponensis]|uniref:TetR family transcriptional regulator n=1 Tax=Actinoplanes nipponensis TaxID=135950 RepID=A0A919ML40_9ACTN|nr:TetR/AcrR family transcriptional regulator [Actinoplanes nipponensis]GIE53539.1 TetR family transcriptional regulator [Actinoplanes nipponensis]